MRIQLITSIIWALILLVVGFVSIAYPKKMLKFRGLFRKPRGTDDTDAIYRPFDVMAIRALGLFAFIVLLLLSYFFIYTPLFS
jgi:hypothetical protein